jgi:carbon storage regulator
MLVLTRKLGEDILIGDSVSVRVVSIENNKVQIGIEAPSNISIYRQELVEKVRRQNQSSILFGRNDFISAARQLKRLWNVRY